MSDLVGNPEDRFPRDAAHLIFKPQEIGLLRLADTETSRNFLNYGNRNWGDSTP